MKYQAKPVIVEAFKIEKILDILPSGDIRLRLDSGEEVLATKEMCARMNPSVGDFWVIQADGYIYLNPKDVFERKYGPPELNALELGAAARRAGIA